MPREQTEILQGVDESADGAVPLRDFEKKALFTHTECAGNTHTNDLVLWMTPTDLISKLCEGADSGGTLDQAQTTHHSLCKFLCSVIMDILLSKQGTGAIVSLLCVCT